MGEGMTINKGFQNFPITFHYNPVKFSANKWTDLYGNYEQHVFFNSLEY